MKRLVRILVVVTMGVACGAKGDETMEISAKDDGAKSFRVLRMLQDMASLFLMLIILLIR